MIEKALAQQGVERKVSVGLPFITPIFKIIEESDYLVGTVIKSMAQLYRKNNGYLIKPLPFKIPDIEFYLAWHQRSENDLGHKWLRELILQQVGMFKFD